MVDPLLERLDVAIKHRASAATPHLMPGPMNIEPLLGSFFTATNTVAHLRIENFRPTPGDRTQSRIPEKLKRIRDRHLKDPLSEMAHFNRGKSFDVQIRVERTQSTQ